MSNRSAALINLEQLYAPLSRNFALICPLSVLDVRHSISF